MSRYDSLRTALLLEPRGHSDQFGALILAPTSRRADFGLVFMDAGGYLAMCGHATMGVTTALIMLGKVKVHSPETIVVYETPAGIVRARARVRRGAVESVSVEDVPSYALGSAVANVDGSRIPVELAYGGNLVAIVESSEVGVPVRRGNLRDLVNRGMAILRSLKAIADSEPRSAPRDVDFVMLTGEPELAGSDGKNIVVFGKGQFDRSPCGTGTAARLAVLHAQGRLRPGQWYVHESIMNTTFRARILRVTKAGGRTAVIPELTGRAFVTQICTVVLNPKDPLRSGFQPFAES